MAICPGHRDSLCTVHNEYFPRLQVDPAGALIDVLDWRFDMVPCPLDISPRYVNGYYLRSHVTVVVAPIAHVHHVVHHVAVPEPIVTHHVVHHHVVKKTCNYLFC